MSSSANAGTETAGTEVSPTRSPALLLALVGRILLALLRGVGGLLMVAVRAVRALPTLDSREMIRATVFFGWESLPLATAVAVSTGGILVLITNVYVVQFGAKTVFGWAAGYSLLREFGPLLVALVMSGRIGARNAAELAAMQINGQLEGLRGIGVDPFALLVAPRLAASAIAVAAVGGFSVLLAVLAAAVLGQMWLDVEARTFFIAFEELLNWTDLFASFAKMLAFGLTIALVSTRAGLLAQGGAQAVGRAAARAVVVSTAVISGVDWLLTVALAVLE